MLQGAHCLPQVQCITTMKKHVDMEHGALLKRYVKKINNHPKPSLEHEPATKCLRVNLIVIFRFSSYKPILKRQ
jgi:hypothetical protein